MNWAHISTKPLTEEFIHLNADKLDWQTMCWFQDFNMDFLREHIDYINKKHCWTKLSNGQRHLTEDFVRQFADQIDWWGLCDNEHFRPSIEFCRQFEDRCLKVHNFFHWTKLKEEQLEEFINRPTSKQIVSGTRIIAQHSPRLTNNFLIKWWQKIDWWAVSKDYMLNYISLEKLKDYLKWSYVTNYQHLGIKLMQKYADKIDWEQIKQWYYIPKKIRLKFEDYLQTENFY